jgi:hypothetical protein
MVAAATCYPLIIDQLRPRNPLCSKGLLALVTAWSPVACRAPCAGIRAPSKAFLRGRRTSPPGIVGVAMRILVAALVLSTASLAGAQTRLAPNGAWVGGTPQIAPNGTWVGGQPQLASQWRLGRRESAARPQRALGRWSATAAGPRRQLGRRPTAPRTRRQLARRRRLNFKRRGHDERARRRR